LETATEPVVMGFDVSIALVARQADFDRSNQMTVAIPKSLGSKGLQPLATTTDFVTLTP
jgi:hypothetical protein